MLKGVSLLPLLLTGCSLTCTEIGCHDGAEIQLSPALPPGSYEIEISDGTDSAFCAVTIGDLDTVDCTGTLTDVRIETGLIFVGGTPQSVTIEITTESGTVADDSIDLEYESHQPNGSGCPPICSVAEAVLSVSTD